MSNDRIAFFTRDAMVHELTGSTTAALNLLAVLRNHDAEITVTVTLAYGRSPRLFFKSRAILPEGVVLSVPGYLRFGAWYAAPFSARAWARMVCRLATRSGMTRWMIPGVLELFRGSVVADAWDLSTPTEAEKALALRTVRTLDAPTVIVNYAFWGPLLASPELDGHKRVIQMHDMLSARVAKFLKSGFALDCPRIDEPTELRWLGEADYVLAAQKSEAEYIAARIPPNASPLRETEVLVQPIVLPLRPASNKAQRLRCLFVGTAIQPNITGIRWFLEQVWPLVLAREPKAELAIAGTVCNAVEGTPTNVHLLGIVPSLEEETDLAGICLVPLLVGSGIKIKLLEALASGKACVSTPIGVQGLEDWAAGAIDVASEPEEFAEAILRLMADDGLRAEREMAARELVRLHFSADSAPAMAFAGKVMTAGVLVA